MGEGESAESKRKEAVANELRAVSNQLSESKVDESQKPALRERVTQLYTEYQKLQQQLSIATEKYDRERMEYDQAKRMYDQRVRDWEAANKAQTARYEAEKAAAEAEYDTAFKSYQTAVCDDMTKPHLIRSIRSNLLR